MMPTLHGLWPKYLVSGRLGGERPTHAAASCYIIRVGGADDGANADLAQLLC